MEFFISYRIFYQIIKFIYMKIIYILNVLLI